MSYPKSEKSALARRNLDRRLSKVRKLDLAAPNSGWIRAVREALGLTMRQLGSRMGVVPSRISQLEKSEITGSTTIKAMREAAAAMECTFVYAVVPNGSLEEILRKRAVRKAYQDLARHNQTMMLENQALDEEDLGFEHQRLINEMLQGSLSNLWNEK
ncbi:MAG: mobile mystery protein A [Sphingorhabdus sp.]